MKGLFDRGVPTAFHSDFTMAPSQPLLLAWSAETRTTAEGNCYRRPENHALSRYGSYHQEHRYNHGHWWHQWHHLKVGSWLTSPYWSRIHWLWRKSVPSNISKSLLRFTKEKCTRLNKTVLQTKIFAKNVFWQGIYSSSFCHICNPMVSNLNESKVESRVLQVVNSFHDRALFLWQKYIAITAQRNKINVQSFYKLLLTFFFW